MLLHQSAHGLSFLREGTSASKIGDELHQPLESQRLSHLAHELYWATETIRRNS